MRAHWNRLKERLLKVARQQQSGFRVWIRGGGSLLIFLLAALSGFWLALPEQQLLQRGRAVLYQASGLIVSAQSMEIGFPLVLRFTQCQLEPLPLPEPLRLDLLQIAPRWRSLLKGSPALAVEAVGYGGRLSGQLGSDGYLEAELRDFDLSRIEGLPGGYRLAGRVHATAQGGMATREGLAWQLELTGLELDGLQALGVERSLALGQGVSRGRLKGQTLKVEALRLERGVLEATGSGSLILGRDLATSRLAATLKFRPGEGLPPLLGDLFELSGQPADAEGWRSLRLNGRLDAPRIR